MAASYSDYEAHFASYGVPDFIAESATLQDSWPLNQALAMFTRLMELIASEEMSAENRAAAVSLALATQRSIEQSTDPQSEVRRRFELARAATISRLLTFGAYPEFVRLAIPGDWSHPAASM